MDQRHQRAAGIRLPPAESVKQTRERRGCGGRQLCLQNLPDAAAVQILLLADPAGADRVDGVLPDADVDGQRKMTCAGCCGRMLQQYG